MMPQLGRWPDKQIDSKEAMIRTLVLALVISAACGGCSTTSAAKDGEDRAISLGFAGCRASTALTTAEVLANERTLGNAVSKATREELSEKYKMGDKLYFVDCRSITGDRIVVGTTRYVVFREGKEIARFGEAIYD